MEYFSPNTVDEALSLLAKYGDKAIPVAGGTFFMSHREELFTSVEVLVDIKKLGLSYIREDSEGLKIGATTGLTEIMESEVVGKGVFRVIRDALNEIEIPEIRNMATIGGDILISAEVDMPPALLALDAKLLLVSPKGKRTLPLDEFYLGYLSTALHPDEIVTEIQIPHFTPKTGAAFHKMKRIAVDVPIVNAAARVTLGHSERCQSSKIVVGGLAEIPTRLVKAEQSLAGRDLDEGSISQAAETVTEIQPLSDIRASGELRQRWAKFAVRQVLHEAYERAKGGI